MMLQLSRLVFTLRQGVKAGVFVPTRGEECKGVWVCGDRTDRGAFLAHIFCKRPLPSLILLFLDPGLPLHPSLSLPFSALVRAAERRHGF